MFEYFVIGALIVIILSLFAIYSILAQTHNMLGQQLGNLSEHNSSVRGSLYSLTKSNNDILGNTFKIESNMREQKYKSPDFLD